MSQQGNTQSEFDVAMFWANKPIKKFVVTLQCRATGASEVRLLAASCSDRAADLALTNTDLTAPAVQEIRLATPQDLGCEQTGVPAQDKSHELARATGLTRFNLPGTPQLYLLGNAPAMAAVQQLQQQHARMAAALADCLIVMQQCDQHANAPRLWPNPVGGLGWDTAVAAAALILREASHASN